MPIWSSRIIEIQSIWASHCLVSPGNLSGKPRSLIRPKSGDRDTTARRMTDRSRTTTAGTYPRNISRHPWLLDAVLPRCRGNRTKPCRAMAVAARNAQGILQMCQN
jgi:hypothetical protein